MQIIRDFSKAPFEQLRIFDLACGEGVYAIEAALRGAEVVAFDGRSERMQAGASLARRLGLDKLKFEQADVRDLAVGRHGHADVILFLGILYHLDDRDIFPVLRNLYEMCRHLLIIDTHIALHADDRAQHDGKVYEGSKFREHADEDSDAVRRSRVGASLDNPLSFWFTRAALCRALVDAGFTSVCECHAPFEPTKPAGRITIVAGKGEPVQLSSYPWVNHKSEDEIKGFLSKLDQQSQPVAVEPGRPTVRQLAQSAVNAVLRPLGVEIRRREIDAS
jgi:SAM-dependent methyltransferase